MRLLHICNDYTGSKVHVNLYNNLDKLGIEQTVFAYSRGCDGNGKNYFESANTNFIYKGILKPYHRLFYYLKIKKVYDELLNSVDPRLFDVSHAVTLFSDGALAYRLYKEYNVPYVVSVRNTDINTFLGVAPHTWPSGIKVLKHASKIVFISKALMEKFKRHVVVRRILPEIQNKFVLQPNGIDNYWLDHQDYEQRNNHHVIYVGRLDKNKNVVRLIRAVLRLTKEIPDIHLHLVGGDGAYENTVCSFVEKYPQYLTYHGKIFNKSILRDLYAQCSVFAMASFHETFGLVYIEALSQNLPVIYTKGQGIDGLFDDSVGIGVNARSIDEITQAIIQIFTHPYSFSNTRVQFNQFRWSNIAARYKSIYNEITNKDTNNNS